MMRYGSGFGPGTGSRVIFHGGAPMVFGGLMMLLIIAALVVLLVLVIKMYRIMTNSKYAVKHAEKPSIAPTEAIAILNDRFAKGEINEEEYKSKKELMTR